MATDATTARRRDRVSSRLALFAVVLAAVFGMAFAVGSAVGTTDELDEPAPGSGLHEHSDHEGLGS